ncbi:MAG: IS66 family transposase [Bacteroidales bacterium]|jgi:transposase|nr:IS66 family transposase [Bacteroidales bacterium]
MASTETVTISKAEYLEFIEAKNTVLILQHELAQLKRTLFGSKSERHIPADPNQPTLFDLPAIEQPEPVKEQISYTRNKKQKKSKAIRLALPAHLERKTEVIEPENLPEDAHKISEKVTEILEYTPGTLYVRQIVRPYYVGQSNDEKTDIIIADLPSRALPKSNAGEGLLSHLIISKYVDHLPFYRQVQMLKRQDVQIAESTINGWFNAIVKLLEPLYETLKINALRTDYLMGDETPIPVQTKDKPGATHKGFYWVYNNPLLRLILFDYQKSRGREGPDELLKNYAGYLQTDGYSAYNNLSNKSKITQLACWAHARRYFEKALDNDKQRSEHALKLIRALYAIERQAKEQNFEAGQIRSLRQEKSKPLLDMLYKWLNEQLIEVLPQSAIGKAIAYTLKLWPRLIVYIEDARLNIDNNLTENSIRPVALGRKNYMFAGSHDAAQRAAMMYSFFATCKINNIEPYNWLKETLTKIADHPANRLEELLPGAIKQ